MTLGCCLPFGIAAIVFAAQVDSKWSAGDWQGAKQASDRAKLWTWASFGVGLLFVVGYFVLILAVGATSTTTGT